MKKVITYGTFDLLHWGHVNLLKRARELGDYLIVGLSSDEFNKIKHKQSFHKYEERRLILEAIRYVDEVIPEDNWTQKEEDIKKYSIDTFVMGSDWENEFDELSELCEVKYLKRTDGISTSQIKEDLSN
ncbi:MAG: glycerol-3-phosphate cytidylyltransferase [Bacteriovorax sp. MedPE-SWde]|nr:MAG: glycerol-3-phosphate cytidylyltransferase [Bacteriovorax sp. MedPE-SWde]